MKSACENRVQVGYQKILQLSYVDKLLSDVARLFRDKYKQDLLASPAELYRGNYSSFKSIFSKALRSVETEGRAAPRQMKSYTESNKSKKTLSSLYAENAPVAASKKAASVITVPEPATVSSPESPPSSGTDAKSPPGSSPDESAIQRNREKMLKKMTITSPKSKAKAKAEASKKTKTARVWELQHGNAKDMEELDFSKKGPTSDEKVSPLDEQFGSKAIVGSLRGELKDFEVAETAVDSASDSEQSDEDEDADTSPTKEAAPRKTGLFGMFRGLVGGKVITSEQLQPILDQMRVRLIEKNVAADVARQLSESVREKLVGKSVGTFQGVQSIVKENLVETLVRILSPRRPINILRDVLDAKRRGQTFAIAFCGVNGVGKSTNLAKVFVILIGGRTVRLVDCQCVITLTEIIYLY